MLSRLTLLAAGNEPKLAEYLPEPSSGAAAGAPPSADWSTGAENPHLRGML